MWGISTSSYAQQLSTKRTRVLILDTCFIKLDTLLVAPNTVKVSKPIQFQVIGNYLKLNCQESSWKDQIISVSYRVLISDLHLVKSNLDTAILENSERAIPVNNPYRLSINNNNNGFITNPGINYNGSISRGFSVGNSQSLVLNSNLNLQLSGKLGNGIEVLAAISDDNIPIQADGNTQLLQEFDKVFIKVSKAKTDIIAGDYDIRNGSQSYFTRYYKKLQGLRVDNISNIGEGTLVSSSNVAISRGKFARQTIDVLEGNQGPYKLTGNNGERFLIVLQGSERVYYDGILLTRGQDYDYIIDYNNAEIIFTPQRLIRRESRIIVEYEYTDQNYLRSLYAINAEYNHPKYNLFFNVYNEQDSKNATGQVELDSMDIALLSQGESSDAALIRSGIRNIQPDAISSSTVFYLKEIDPETGDTILTYTSDYQNDAVTAFFSEVPLGQGDYRISSTSGVNGRVYEYVGKQNGNYLPVIQLIAPEKRQLFSLGASYVISDKTNLKVESSFSNFDNNRFSVLDNENNQGIATKIILDHNLMNKKKKNKWQPFFHLSYENLGQNYSRLNPFRNQEFNRDWNIGELNKTRENLATSSIGIQKGEKWNMSYDFTYYNRLNQFSGHRHLPKIQYKSEHTQAFINGNILSTLSSTDKSVFTRPTLDITQKLNFLQNWSIRIKYLGEKNEKREISSNTLIGNSFSFDEYYIYLEAPKNDIQNSSIFIKRRIDKLPQSNELVTVAQIDEAGMEGLLQSDATRLLWNISYRKFDTKKTELISTPSTSTLLGRVDFSLNVWKGFIQSVSSVNISSGQEARREFQFIKVEKGEGNYIYLGDLNNDGGEQINEYEIAVFSDQADYIRVNIVNNEFIKTENQGVNQSIRINPSKLFETKSTGFKKFLSKINATSIIKVDQKREANTSSQNGFFQFEPRDTNTVAYNALLNNNLFFNRGNSNFDIQLGHRYTFNRFVQITGFEQRNQRLHFFKARFNPHRSFDIVQSLEWGKREYDSQFFDNKDLDIDFIRFNPKLVYRPTTQLRFTTNYTYEDRQQIINELESSRSHEISLETTWRQASTSSFNAIISFVDITYSGPLNTPVSYAILEGLNNGNNFLWNLSLTKRLSGNVDFLLSYEGRKTGNSPTVHIGRMQVKANF
jgi:hypothetical protein